MKGRFISLFTLIICTITISYSQDLSDALETMNNKQYDLSLKFFRKAWKKKKNDKNICYLYGKSILNSNTEKTDAIPLLKSVVDKDIDYKDVSLYMGKAYFYNYEFEKAQQLIEYFLKKYDFSKDKEAQQKKQDANLFLAYIQTAKKHDKDSLNVRLVNLGKELNTKRSEFYPFISEDGTSIYYSSNKKYDSGLLELITNGYTSSFDNKTGTWKKMKSLGKNVNSTEHETITGISYAGEKVLISVQWGQETADLFITDKGRRRFQELTNLEDIINSKSNENFACFSKNEDTLFFSSDRPGGYGGLDLYMSIKLPNNRWGNPINLGESINSKYDETAPYINYNNQSFYFASNRPESMGGYDIFQAQRSQGKFINIKNIGAPINDLNDNYTISFSRSGRYAYISKQTKGNFGALDLYQVIFNDVEPDNVIYTGTIRKKNDKNTTFTNEEIEITALNKKDHSLFAKSSYTSSQRYTFAFPPGEYIIQIKGKNIQTHEEYISIPENEVTEQIITHHIEIN